MMPSQHKIRVSVRYKLIPRLVLTDFRTLKVLPFLIKEMYNTLSLSKQNRIEVYFSFDGLISFCKRSKCFLEIIAEKKHSAITATD